ncbi:hypothetical protein D3C80_2106930 [compost metagenome]
MKDRAAGGAAAKKTKYLGEVVSRYDNGRVKIKFTEENGGPNGEKQGAVGLYMASNWQKRERNESEPIR